MGTVVDSSVVIAVERGKLDPSRLADEDDSETIVFAAVTASELLHGVLRAHNAIARTRRERFVEEQFNTYRVIPFDLAIARVHATLAAELSAAGTAVGVADLQIAATAVWLEFRVATRDLRSFPKIKGLDVVQW